MKKLLLVALLTIFCSSLALAQSLSGIPTPQGAKITTSMDVTRDQLLQQLTVMSSSFLPGDADMPNVNWDELKAACEPLKRVQFAEMEITGKYSSSDVISLFEKKVAGRRILYYLDGNSNEGVVMIACPKDGGYFCAQISRIMSAPKGKVTGAKIQATRIYGFPDMAGIAKFIGGLTAALGANIHLSVR